nr:MAG TPA: excisionase [Siphoviridae sp. ctedi74]
MTLEELKLSEKETISAAVAGKVLGVDPQLIRVQARQNKDALGFPVILLGRNVRIPRRSFIAFVEGKLIVAS